MSFKNSLRSRLRTALEKPLPEKGNVVHSDVFNPWEDVVSGIHGFYASQSDDLMIGALEAVRDRTTFEFIERNGFAAEFMFYVLAGHGLLTYGTSPRSGWASAGLNELWDALIEKWKAYAAIVWEQDMDAPPPSTGK